MIPEPYFPFRITSLEPCPYLEGPLCRMLTLRSEPFTAPLLDQLLAMGFRRFGATAFRPYCPSCEACVPLRISPDRFHPSASQRRVWRKNQDLTWKWEKAHFSGKTLLLFQQHEQRFGKNQIDATSFQESFCTPLPFNFQLSYFLGEHLAGAGFIDLGKRSLSSVYFAFDPEMASRSLGTFSILAELHLAKTLGLAHYYLGYWQDSHRHLGYKIAFQPSQWFHWGVNQWQEGRPS